MADTQSIPVMVRLSPDQVRAVDDWRQSQEDVPSRAETIRRLVDFGIGKAFGEASPRVPLRAEVRGRDSRLMRSASRPVWPVLAA